ncbi:retention module-containing protein [Halomonas sp. A11-A]|uniref:retention module-containing protein n=1 Tax=Halomonas sp. A11-A TaxID=2183985 RepID=UPI000D712C30|nr:retention module-containing protein [Halomonas sp. A11-A]PWV71281.1 hypothetical protein DER72_12245 [Halomonas sp. A11-A]
MAIATVISISGQAWARDADGNLRELRVGDTLHEGETLVTADNAIVQLDFGDGLGPTLIEGGQQVAMTPELDSSQSAEPSEFSALDEDLEALLAAIDEGEGDLLDALDATAAGAGPGGGADGGHSFVMLGRIAEDVNPLAFNFEGGQLAGIGFPEAEPELLAEEEVAEPEELAPGSIGVTLVDVNSLNEGAVPVAGTTTNVPVGSTVSIVVTDALGNSATATAVTGADGSYSTEIDLSGLQDGDLRVEAVVTDQTGSPVDAGYDAVKDTTAEAMITIDTITGDDVINSEEATQTITITGSVGGDAGEGDTVTLTVGGQEFTGLVGEDLTYAIDVPGSLLAENDSVTAEVTGADEAGNPFSADTERGYDVDATAPTVSVALEDASGDIYSAEEIEGGVNATVTLGSSTEVGDTLVVTDGKGNELFNGLVTQEMLDDGLMVTITDLDDTDTEISVTATVTDPAGNSATDSDNGVIDAVSPAVSVELEAATGDIYSAEEIEGGVNATVTLGSSTEVGDTLVVTDGKGNELFNGDVTQEMLDNGLTVTITDLDDTDTEISVTATVTDPAGNSATDSDNGVIDAVSPAVSVELEAATGDIYSAEEIEGGVNATVTLGSSTEVGDTLVVVDGKDNELFNGDVTQEMLDNGLTVTITDLDGTDTAVSVTATVTDPAGNSASATDDGVIDATAPTVSVALEDATGDIYSAEEIADGVNATVTLGGSTEIGDTLVVVDGKGNELFNGAVTQAMLDDGQTVTITDLDGTDTAVSVTATVTDPAGNSASATDDGVIDATAPTVSVTLGDEGAPLAEGEETSIRIDFSEEAYGVESGEPLTGEQVAELLELEGLTLNDAGLTQDPTDPTVWTGTVVAESGFNGDASATIPDQSYADAAGNLGSEGADRISLEPAPDPLPIPEATVDVDREIDFETVTVPGSFENLGSEQPVGGSGDNNIDSSNPGVDSGFATLDFGAAKAGQIVTISWTHQAFGGWEDGQTGRGGTEDKFEVFANGALLEKFNYYDPLNSDNTVFDPESPSFDVVLDENGQVILEFRVTSTHKGEIVNVSDISASLVAASFVYPVTLSGSIDEGSIEIFLVEVEGGTLVQNGNPLTPNADGFYELDGDNIAYLQVRPSDGAESITVNALAISDQGMQSAWTSGSVDVENLAASDNSSEASITLTEVEQEPVDATPDDAAFGISGSGFLLSGSSSDSVSIALQVAENGTGTLSFTAVTSISSGFLWGSSTAVLTWDLLDESGASVVGGPTTISGNSSEPVTIEDLPAGDYTLTVTADINWAGLGGSASASITDLELITTLPPELVPEAQSVTGNVINDLGVDGNPDVRPAGTMLLVDDGGTFVEVPLGEARTVQGQFGTLTLSGNGDYTYQPDANLDNIGQQDVFTYQLKTPDGASAEASLTISLLGDESLESMEASAFFATDDLSAFAALLEDPEEIETDNEAVSDESDESANSTEEDTDGESSKGSEEQEESGSDDKDDNILEDEAETASEDVVENDEGDAGSSEATGAEDTSSEDTSPEDTGLEDSGLEDTGLEDTGLVDTSSEDTGSEDTGSEETDLEDTSSEDNSYEEDEQVTEFTSDDKGDKDELVEEGEKEDVIKFEDVVSDDDELLKDDDSSMDKMPKSVNGGDDPSVGYSSGPDELDTTTNTTDQ